MANLRRGEEITYKGKTQTVTAWAREIGINVDTLRHRLYDNNWTLDEAMTTPPGQKQRAKRGRYDFYEKGKQGTPRRKKDKTRLCVIKKCKMCIYHEGGGQDSDITCGYIIKHIPPQRRPCPAGQCTVFEPIGSGTPIFKADERVFM